MPNHSPCKSYRPVFLKSQGGWALHGFSKVVVGGLLLGSVAAFLASTSFLSDFILDRMLEIPVVVNPIAAATHQNLKSEAIADAKQKIDVIDSAQAVTSKHKASKKTDVTQSSDLELMSPLVDESSIAHVLDSSPDKALDLVATSPHFALDSSNHAEAQAIVVLGGGLTRDQHGVIIPNSFTQLRLLQAISQHRATGLPIFLTGVEAPYMQKFLQSHGESAQWLEARSMNTCENARFSALLLQTLGGAPRVELVTDVWHIPRARWLFAMNGIETVAVPALLPGDPTPWWPDVRNLTHTRRAVHELIAFTRDRLFGVVGCREIP